MALDPKLKDAVAYMNDHAHGLRAYLIVADAVADITALEQAANEAEGRRKAALDDLDTQIHTRNAELAAATDAAQHATDDAKTQADGIIRDARDAAVGIVEAARSTAAADTAQVQADASAALAATRADLATATDRLASLNADIDTAAALLDETRTETDALIAKADKARAFLADLQAKG